MKISSFWGLRRISADMHSKAGVHKEKLQYISVFCIVLIIRALEHITNFNLLILLNDSSLKNVGLVCQVTPRRRMSPLFLLLQGTDASLCSPAHLLSSGAISHWSDWQNNISGKQICLGYHKDCFYARDGEINLGTGKGIELISCFSALWAEGNLCKWIRLDLPMQHSSFLVCLVHHLLHPGSILAKAGHFSPNNGFV